MQTSEQKTHHFSPNFFKISRKEINLEQKMELKLLNFCELEQLYAQELTADFPKSELKPLRAMGRLMEQNRYDPLLVTEQNEPVGYALVWLPEGRQGGLLEYLGVLRGKRDHGIGTQILSLLGERYGQLFGEAEAPTSPDPAENSLRRRRLDFYCRNGFRILDYQCALFGVHFNCLYRGPETDDRKVESLHMSVYASYFSPAHMARYIQLPLAPGEAIHPAPSWLEEDETEIFP
jgi:GNAT superfamily N-acetyltransferase